MKLSIREEYFNCSVRVAQAGTGAGIVDHQKRIESNKRSRFYTLSEYRKEDLIYAIIKDKRLPAAIKKRRKNQKLVSRRKELEGG